MANFWIFFKNPLGTFFTLPKPYLTAKFQRKVMNGCLDISVTDSRTYAHTYIQGSTYRTACCETKKHTQNEHWNNSFHHVLLILTGFYVFSFCFLFSFFWVTTGNKKKILEKCSVGILWRDLYCIQSKPGKIFFTKMQVSQNQAKIKLS